MASSEHRRPALIRLWLALTAILPVVLAIAGWIMHKRQSADPVRFRERLGRASAPRPAGRVIWLHAASVGEVTSVARLARQIADQDASTLLVTTATATGGATVARLLPGALHQFAPLDTRAAVQRFLAHWRPDAALFVEGDLWPRMILSLHAYDCPMVLLNARASRTRLRFPAASAALLARMRLITVQDCGLISDLEQLGLDPTRLRAPGNLKADIDIPAVDEHMRNQWTAAAQGRNLWAAVSTHPGEEAIILDVQARLAGRPLLILVPRHPARGAELAAELARRGLAFSRHSTGEKPDALTEVHLVDTLGMTGTVYAATGLAFIGGSLVEGHGGHTPFEPISLGCAVVSGTHVQNFSAAYTLLQKTGAACLVKDGGALSNRIQSLLSDSAAREAIQHAAYEAYRAQDGASMRTLDTLRDVLPNALITPSRIT